MSCGALAGESKGGESSTYSGLGQGATGSPKIRRNGKRDRRMQLAASYFHRSMRINPKEERRSINLNTFFPQVDLFHGQLTGPSYEKSNSRDLARSKRPLDKHDKPPPRLQGGKLPKLACTSLAGSTNPVAQFRQHGPASGSSLPTFFSLQALKVADSHGTILERKP